MGTRQIGRPDNGSQIVRILDIIQKDQERILPLLLRKVEHILNIRVFIRGCYCNNALMLFCFRELVKPLFCNKV